MKTQAKASPTLPIEEAALQAVAQKMGAQISHVVCATFVELLVLLREQEKTTRSFIPKIHSPHEVLAHRTRGGESVEHQQGTGLSVDPQEGDPILFRWKTGARPAGGFGCLYPGTSRGVKPDAFPSGSFVGNKGSISTICSSTAFLPKILVNTYNHKCCYGKPYSHHSHPGVCP